MSWNANSLKIPPKFAISHPIPLKTFLLVSCSPSRTPHSWFLYNGSIAALFCLTSSYPWHLGFSLGLWGAPSVTASSLLPRARSCASTASIPSRNPLQVPPFFPLTRWGIAARFRLYFSNRCFCIGECFKDAYCHFWPGNRLSISSKINLLIYYSVYLIFSSNAL